MAGERIKIDLDAKIGNAIIIGCSALGAITLGTGIGITAESALGLSHDKAIYKYVTTEEEGNHYNNEIYKDKIGLYIGSAMIAIGASSLVIGGTLQYGAATAEQSLPLARREDEIAEAAIVQPPIPTNS